MLAVKVPAGSAVDRYGGVSVNVFRKAYSVAGAVLMLQFFAQLYFIAAAIFTIVNANDNAKDVHSAFKNSDTFAGLHSLNGDLIALITLVMVGLSFGSRYPRLTTLMSVLLFVLIFSQHLLTN